MCLMYTVSDGPGYVKILKQFLNLVHTESIQPRPRQQLHSSIPLNRIQTPSPSFPPPPQSMVRRQQSCWTPEWAASSSSGQGGAQPGSFLNKGQQPPLGGGGCCGQARTGEGGHWRPPSGGRVLGWVVGDRPVAAKAVGAMGEHGRFQAKFAWLPRPGPKTDLPQGGGCHEQAPHSTRHSRACKKKSGLGYLSGRRSQSTKHQIYFQNWGK